MFSVRYEIAFFRNRVRVRNLTTGEVRERAASPPFSCEHFLLGDPDRASRLVGDLLRETDRRRYLRIFAIADVAINDSPRASDRANVVMLLKALGFSKIRLT